MPEQPTIALVHGAFAESASWNPVIERLHARSLDVVAIGNPLRSLSGDAAYVRDIIDSIGGPVLLVAHSYGGMVATQAAAQHPAVVGIVYVCAFAPATGESAFQLSTKFPGSSLGDALNAYPTTADGTELAIRSEVFQFCADASAAQAALMAATQRPATQAALSEDLPTPAPAWSDRPTWFVFGEQDLNIPAELHRFMAERAGATVTRELAGASHAISVSEPAAVAEMILDAVSTLTGDPAQAIA